MITLYWTFAILGSTILIVQVVLSLLGAEHGADHDIHVDLDHGDADFGHISFRTIVAFVSFFGIAGLAAHHAGRSTGITLAIACGTGFLAFYGVAFVMAKFHQLRSSGNVAIENTVGRTGRVYLAIPGSLSGIGKVTVSVQGRTMEFAAVTPGHELPTAATCVVKALHSKDTLVVEPVAEMAST